MAITALLIKLRNRSEFKENIKNGISIEQFASMSIDEKLNASAYASIYIQAQRRQPNTKKFVQPFHAKHLVLNEIPHAHTKTSLSISWTTYQNFLMYCAEGNAI